jgi:cytidylate kinase
MHVRTKRREGKKQKLKDVYMCVCVCVCVKYRKRRVEEREMRIIKAVKKEIEEKTKNLSRFPIFPMSVDVDDCRQGTGGRIGTRRTAYGHRWVSGTGACF